MSKVSKCMCEECYYNDNFVCQADYIEVRSSADDYQVKSSQETCCNTFKHGRKE
ncbi:MAG: DUF1540 domain-containing protein [Syntrophomonadaceae bacterium]|nr:DUF1540 domain-containing protein [Syntrophomonadaceae bacterium]